MSLTNMNLSHQHKNTSFDLKIDIEYCNASVAFVSHLGPEYVWILKDLAFFLFFKIKMFTF